MRLIVLLSLLMLSVGCTASPKKVTKKPKTMVAIIDTGFSEYMATPKTKAALCKTGHFDFTTNTPNIGYDEFGHGTFIANLIIENANNDNVCLLIYKVNAMVNDATRNHVSKAIIKAYNTGSRVVNISLGDPIFSVIEQKIVSSVTRKGMKLFVAAGNERADLNNVCSIYPACLKGNKGNLYVVGATDESGLVETYSNKGSRVQIYEFGTIPGVGRGTSFATPRAVARYLKSRVK